MADNMSTIAAHQGRMDTNMIQVGIVKDNRDPKKMGRLKVWIENSSSLEGAYRDWETDRKSTRLNSSHRSLSRMPSSA